MMYTVETMPRSAIQRVCLILAETGDWTPAAPLQRRLGRSARAIDACELEGLIESRSVRMGLRGPLRRMVRLTDAGRATVNPTTQAGCDK